MLTGTRYDKNLDIKDIAKMVRRDLKAEELTASVRISRYAGGQSIHIDLKDTGLDRRSEWARALVANVETIANAYNFDGSDHMTDYYNVNFYTHVSVVS